MPLIRCYPKQLPKAFNNSPVHQIEEPMLTHTSPYLSFFLPWQDPALTSEINAVSHTPRHPRKHAVFMFLSFHPLLLPSTGNFLMHESIVCELQLKSHHLPLLKGLYSKLNVFKYFTITSAVTDNELWLMVFHAWVLV